MKNKILLLIIALTIINNISSDDLENYELNGTWRVDRKIDKSVDGFFEASWGETGIKELSRDMIIDIRQDHPDLTYWGGGIGEWDIYAHGIYIVDSIVEIDDKNLKIFLKENWSYPNESNEYWRGNRTGVVYIKLLNNNLITLRVGEESDEFFNFLSLKPEHGYAFTWIRTDGPQEEFQQEAN